VADPAKLLEGEGKKIATFLLLDSKKIQVPKKSDIFSLILITKHFGLGLRLTNLSKNNSYVYSVDTHVNYSQPFSTEIPGDKNRVYIWQKVINFSV